MRRGATICLILAGWAAPAMAGGAAQDDAPALRNLLKCRGIADGTARLACYDEQVRNFGEAAARRDVVVVDHGQIEAAKRGLFGFSLPRIPLFATRDAGGSSDKPELDRLDAVIRSAGQSGGKWVLILDDGARWEQVESGRDADEPRAGMPIAIRRASFGTYFARIGRSITMRIRRVS